VTGKFVQQQLYTRERGGIFHATDGYDTIAISKGLDKAFVKKYLHPFCLYHSPKTVADSTLYPEAVTIFQPETGDLVIGQAVFVPADFTGQRSTYFMHNYIIPATQKDEWIKQPEKLFQLNEYKTSYAVELGKILPERNIVSFNETDILSVKDELLLKLDISASHFKQLLFAVLTSIAGKKKVFISLNVPVLDYTKYALLLLELVYTYLPYAHRRKLGAITFSSEPEGKNYIHVTFFEPGTLNVNDRSIEKQFIFDFAGGQISGVDIEGQHHEYLELAINHFTDAKRMDDFFAFAEMSLSGLPEVQTLEVSSYYQLSALYLTLKYGHVSIYKKVGFLHSLLKFLQVNSEEKPELVELFLNIVTVEKLAGNPDTALDYINAVVSINTIVRSDEALSFILATLEYYQNKPLFHKLWKTIEQDKHTHKAIVMFIHEHPDYDGLLELYLDERFKQVVRVEDILNELAIMLRSPYLLSVEKFKLIVIKKMASAITYDSFEAVLAVKGFVIDQQGAEFIAFKKDLLDHAWLALLRLIRVQELTLKDIITFGAIFTKELTPKGINEVKLKDNFLITNALYQLFSNPAQAGTYNLRSLTTAARIQLRSLMLKLVRNNLTAEHFQLLVVAFETEYNDVDYQGLLEYMIRYSDDKTLLSFIRGNLRLLENKDYYQTLKKYLSRNPKSLWKQKALRKELRSIKNNSSFKKLLREIETETAGPFVKFFKKNGKSLLLAVVIVGGVGGGAWFALDLIFGEDLKPNLPKTSETTVGNKDTPKEDESDLSTPLDSFKVATTGDVGQPFVLELGGKQAKSIVGHVQGAILTDINGIEFQLDFLLGQTAGPFGQNGRLQEGITLRGTEYDFDATDGTTEVVLFAKVSEGDQPLENYLWVYSIKTNSLDGASETLKPIFMMQGITDVNLKGKLLSVGEQDEIYEYSVGTHTFIPQNN
jgi:hypothetical protein